MEELKHGKISFRFSLRKKIVIGCTTIINGKKQENICVDCEGCDFMGKPKEEVLQWKEKTEILG
jgi:hypothetical protein